MFWINIWFWFCLASAVFSSVCGDFSASASFLVGSAVIDSIHTLIIEIQKKSPKEE